MNIIFSSVQYNVRRYNSNLFYFLNFLLDIILNQDICIYLFYYLCMTWHFYRWQSKLKLIRKTRKYYYNFADVSISGKWCHIAIYIVLLYVKLSETGIKPGLPDSKFKALIHVRAHDKI